jgi:hypothetical protein
MAIKKYRVRVKVEFTLDIPVTASNEDDAIEEFEKVIHKHDNYEIVNRAIKKEMEIVDINEAYE